MSDVTETDKAGTDHAASFMGSFRKGPTTNIWGDDDDDLDKATSKPLSETPETDARVEHIQTTSFRGEIVSPAFARDLEKQRDAAREDAERLASDLRAIQSIINDNESVFGHCTIGNKALAAHEALTAKK